MSENAILKLGDKQIELPVIVGSEGEKGVDISKLRSETGYITVDDGFGNTGSCQSTITFIDGEKGILRYRGYPIEQLAEKSRFVEVAYLLIHGELPTKEQMEKFSSELADSAFLPENMRHMYQGFPPWSHPMAILSAMINALSTFRPPEMRTDTDEGFAKCVTWLLSKVRTIAAFSYKMSREEPFMYPRSDLRYCANFLHMMFSKPYSWYEVPPAFESALNKILVLHADHEQNCSTSTVRMVGSSKANIFASIAAGVCALWGPLHGGANQAVLEMLTKIRDDGIPPKKFVELAKDKNSGQRLMGFGHRVYKNFDPRANILKGACDEVLEVTGTKDPLLDIAKELESIALEEDYFIERKLYPNVDFYSGIIMQAMGIPVNVFTVMFSIGRLPGWLAHWKEVNDNPGGRIYRPRQVYQGSNERNYVEMADRG